MADQRTNNGSPAESEIRRQLYEWKYLLLQNIGDEKKVLEVFQLKDETTSLVFIGDEI